MEPVTIQRQIDLDVSSTEMWDLIADPQQLAAWLGDSADIDLRPGGRGQVDDDGVRRDILVERIESRRGLAFTWWEHDDPSATSRVVFEIEAMPTGGSRLNITETLSADIAAGSAEATAAQLRWDVRALSLWACTVGAALACSIIA